LAVVLASCGESKGYRYSAKDPNEGAPKDRPVHPNEPNHITVDHILIGVKSPSFDKGKRDAAEAKTFAQELYGKLKAGADWSEAKRQYSEDLGPGGAPGGPYGMANEGVRAGPGERPRSGMVAAFGNVGFLLDVGEIGLAEFHAVNSPYGYHIIKRIR
jgi:hypothetical protein